MTQGYDKYELPNSDGATFRANLNDILEAAVTQNSGDDPPNTTNTSYAYQTWVDTSQNVVKIRDAAAAGTWYSLYSIDSDGKPTGAVAYGNYTIATNDTAGTGGTTAITVDTSQNVGIGIASPGERIHVFGSASAPNQKIRIQTHDTASAVAGIQFYSRDASNNNKISEIVTSNADLTFKTDNTLRAVIDSSGRFLVGAPTAVETSSNSLIQAAEANGSFYIAARNDTSVISGNSIGGMRFYGNDSDGNYDECARIECAADGTHSSTSKPSRLRFLTTASTASSPTERMRIENRGIVYGYSTDAGHIQGLSNGAGTTYRLFAGRHSATGADGTGTESYRVWSNGNVQNTNNSYGGLSDIKLKENIVDAGSQWDDLKAIQIRKYNFKEETGHQTHTQLGVVAQEVELVSPGLVTEAPDSDAEGNDLGTVTKSVNYSVLYMKAVKALQEAIARIETLEAKVAALESA